MSQTFQKKMKRGVYIALLSFIMASILGVVFVQVYWIYSAWKTKEEAFSLAVNQSLAMVAEEAQEREITDYLARLQKIKEERGTLRDANFTDYFLFIDEDQTTNLSTYYAYSILEEDFAINPSFQDLGLGEISTIKNYKRLKRTTVVNRDFFTRENQEASVTLKTLSIDDIDVYSQAIYRSTFYDYSQSLPIHQRTTLSELDLLLRRELSKKDIDLHFEFGVYKDGLATKIRSNTYSEEHTNNKYVIPIFTNEAGEEGYELVVFFPKKDQYVFSSILGISGISLFLTVFIILASSTAIYQIIRQKKTSEMKTDFINNMSHEFKTPIATINLALDAINNPKVFSKEDSVKQYLKMIREENTRMLTQVENVLWISRLDRSHSPIVKELSHLNELVQEAIGHVQLIVKNKGGKVASQLMAEDDSFYGNKAHFTNVIINVLDNAIKYCDEIPHIEVSTKNEEKKLLLTIKDNGIGMDVVTQKRVFDKFYRAQSGNIHNVKGHGLGLSYVKKIVDLHQGKISLESKKTKGTAFTITLDNYDDKNT